MTPPQKENGFTPIAHTLLEAFYRAKFLEYERVIMLCIWRKTYGWGKKEDWISNSQFHEETGVPKPHITRTIKALRHKKVITKNSNKITINKNYWMWEVERRVTSPGNSVTSPGNKKLPHQVPTKESKETIQKKEAKIKFSHSKSLIKKDMSWNKKADDYEEGVIDLDGDISLEEIKKPQTKKYPNAPAVRKVFLEVLGKSPANWKINKNQLQACENLYTERGLVSVKKALLFAEEHKKEEYCPKISSPYDLDSKWTKLGEYKLSL